MELYGNDDLGAILRRESAVADKLRRPDKNTFHNPRELPQRARAVLNSLKNDAENIDDRTAYKDQQVRPSQRLRPRSTTENWLFDSA